MSFDINTRKFPVYIFLLLNLLPPLSLFLYPEYSMRSSLYKLHGKNHVDNITYEDILKALRDQVLKSLVVIISTGERKDANSIFEILNAKGKRLASVD